MMYDIIIVGGGPAGLTAALYALRAEKSVLVFEKMGLGGQIALSERVENFPGIPKISGLDFADALSGQVSELGGEIRFGAVKQIKNGTTKTVVTDDGEFSAKSVIIATGLRNRLLGAEGEERLVGRGVSFCAVCDGAFYKDKTVAVIGGGNTAVQEAEYLSELAKKVYLIHRRDAFRAEEALVKRLKECNNVELLLETIVEKLCGTDKLTGLDLFSTANKSKMHLDVDGAFVAVGQIPQNSEFEGLVTLSDGGYILAGEDCKTNREGIFAAGDCRTKSVRQLTTAVGDGSVAALNAVKYLEGTK